MKHLGLKFGISHLKDPFLTPKRLKWGSNRVESYFSPNLCHICCEGTLLIVVNNDQIRFLKELTLRCTYGPLWGSNRGQKGGQSLVSTRFLLYSQWKDLFENYYQCLIIIFKQLTPRHILAPFWGQVGPIGGQNLILSDIRYIHRKGTFLKVMNGDLLRFSEKNL